MTNQEAFDRVWDWFVVQGQPASFHQASSVSASCRYRHPDGHRCAAGVLIPDDEYRQIFEGRNITSIERSVPALYGVDSDLLRQIQNAHDEPAYRPHGEFTDEITWRLRGVAERFGLTVPAEVAS